MDKKRILFLMHMPPPVHGAAVMGGIVRDCESMREQFDCRYINYSVSRSMEEINHFSCRKILVVAGLLWKVFRETILFRPDIVYLTPSFRPLGFRKDRMVVRFLKYRGCRVVLHLHNKGVSAQAGNPGYGRKFRSFFAGTKVILLSGRLFPDIARFVDRSDVFLCPNGIDPVPERQTRREDSGSPVLLFMSSSMDGKGADDLLEACGILSARGVPFRCRIVGPRPPVSSSIALMQKGGQIVFDGPLYGKDKAEAYRKADVFVHPTREDCFPLVILEAMSAGLPVVASAEGGIPDEVVDGETGLLSRKGDAADLARCLEMLLTDPALRLKMGEAGRERYESRFTKERFENALLQIMEKTAQ